MLGYPAGARGRLTHGAAEARWKGRELADLEKEAVPRQPELVRVRGEAQEVVRRDLGCHGTRYVPNARGWYVYPVRTVRGAWGQAALCVRYVPNAGGWYA